MPEQAIAQPYNDLPGGPMNIDPSFAELRLRDGGKRGVSYFDTADNPREVALADNEEFFLGPHGNNGEPRRPYIRTVDAEGNTTDVLFTDFITAKEAAQHTPEQQVAQELDGASTAVFRGIYGRILETTKSKTSPEEFVDDYFTNADKLSSNIEGKTARDYSEQYTQKLTNQDLPPDTIQRGTLAISEGMNYTKQLIESGKVSKEAASAFWQSLPSIKNGLSLRYNDLTRKSGYEGVIPTVDQSAYHDVIHRAAQQMPEGTVQQQESGGFMHFNQQVGLSSDTTDRIYISAKPDGDPAAVLQTWMDTLRSQGLTDSVYFKVPTFINNRFESVVVYVTKANTPEQVSAMMHDFMQRCDPALLDDQKMPTGVELSTGIFAAPEPNELNTLLRYATRDGKDFDTVSYNEFSASMVEIAMRLATRELAGQGLTADKVKPKDIAAGAEKYFAELMLLSGIDPESMTSTAR